MCWSKEVSLVSWILGTIGSLLLYKRDKAMGLFLLVVCQMQLIDGLLWISYENNNLDMNLLVSKIGAIVNHMEPIVLWLGIPNPTRLLNIMGYLYTAFAIFYTKYVIENTKPGTVTKESAPHLIWDWNNQKYYIEFYYFMFLSFLTYGVYYASGKNMIIGSIPVVSLLTSTLVYRKKNVTGSMWCFFAVGLPWALLLKK